VGPCPSFILKFAEVWCYKAFARAFLKVYLEKSSHKTVFDEDWDGWSQIKANDVLQEMKSMQEPHNHRDTKHLVGDGPEKRPHASR
jgi:hypothetical protein